MTNDVVASCGHDPNPWAEAVWLNAPPDWSIDAKQALVARTANRTDFWQTTFYGFQRDDGHAYLTERGGDFSATLTVDGEYRHLYDQAGLMIRLAPVAWIKFGVEVTDGAPHLGAVVTDGTSDWSAMPVLLDGPLSLRATRLGDAVLLQYRTETGTPWAMARLAPIPRTSHEDMSKVRVGPYLCSPERDGFKARFSGFAVTEAQVRALHT